MPWTEPLPGLQQNIQSLSGYVGAAMIDNDEGLRRQAKLRASRGAVLGAPFLGVQRIGDVRDGDRQARVFLRQPRTLARRSHDQAVATSQGPRAHKVLDGGERDVAALECRIDRSPGSARQQAEQIEPEILVLLDDQGGALFLGERGGEVAPGASQPLLNTAQGRGLRARTAT